MRGGGRAAEQAHGIRRRRECVNCNQRFTTYERVAGISLLIVKRGPHRVASRLLISDDGLRMRAAWQDNDFVVDDEG